jgi:hypothetical protein
MNIIQIAIPQTRIETTKESPDKELVTVDLFNNGLNQFETFELNKNLLNPPILPISVETADLRLEDSIKVDLDSKIVVFLTEDNTRYEKEQEYFFPVFREILNPEITYTRFDTEFSEL